MFKGNRYAVIELLFCCLVIPAHAQLMRHDKSETTKTPEEVQMQNTPSAWRATATDLSTFRDPVTASLRALRDAYWDRQSGALYPLPGPPRNYLLPPSAHYKSDIPAAKDIPGSVWVVAVFESSRSVLSRSERSIYTEVALRIEKTFCDSSLHVGDSVDVGTYGGSVILASGEKLNYQLAPREYDLEPGHKYLVQLSPFQVGNLYVDFDSWEIKDGKLRGNSYSAVHGRRVAGLPADDESDEEAFHRIAALCKKPEDR